MAKGPRSCPICGAEYPEDVLFCSKDGAPLASGKNTSLTDHGDDPYLGVVLADQFAIERLIGVGAMGRVYLAHQKGIDRPVAVKILHRELLRDDTVIRRFHREARIASRLSHPNVVQVLMTGELPNQGEIGGEGYLVMEYLDGISLRSALAGAGDALPLPRALHVALQICDAVGEAHGQGIVHRDLKPENVMLVRRGDDHDYVKVLDFGVARVEEGDGTLATQAGAIFGTARYMSPEAARGEPVGPAADVYAIATMLFQCLAGRTPFDGDSAVSILVKQSSEPAPALRSVERAAYVPGPIAEVVERNLAKTPDGRASDARLLGRDLVAAARRGGLSPDDLVPRSTLLGGGGGPVQLASLQATKSIGLTPELSAAMAGSGVEPTVSDEPAPASLAAAPGVPVEPTVADEPPPSEVLAASSSATSTRVLEPVRPVTTATRVLEPVRPGGATAPGRTPLPLSTSTQVLEPVRSPSGLPTPPPSGASPTPAPASSGSARPSLASEPESTSRFPDASWIPPEPSPGPPLSGRLLPVAAFVIGALLVVLGARALGAFDRPESEVDRYVRRARAALEGHRFSSPNGEGVLEVTDAALERFPGEPRLVALRARAAAEVERRLATAEGTEAARLRRLLRKLRGPGAAAVSVEATTSATPSSTTGGSPDPESQRRPTPATGRPPSPGSAPPAPTTRASASARPAPASASSGPTALPAPASAGPEEPSPPSGPDEKGRWL